mmetsp:Transcript_33079/g.74717  ORF Transcript_33079/g.74717 Transcript_33079/m.74717 type:complete len:391 (+) Transcript_33079:561-1733(+)
MRRQSTRTYKPARRRKTTRRSKMRGRGRRLCLPARLLLLWVSPTRPRLPTKEDKRLPKRLLKKLQALSLLRAASHQPRARSHLMSSRPSRWPPKTTPLERRALVKRQSPLQPSCAFPRPRSCSPCWTCLWTCWTPPRPWWRPGRCHASDGPSCRPPSSTRPSRARWSPVSSWTVTCSSLFLAPARRPRWFSRAPLSFTCGWSKWAMMATRRVSRATRKPPTFWWTWARPPMLILGRIKEARAAKFWWNDLMKRGWSWATRTRTISMMMTTRSMRRTRRATAGTTLNSCSAAGGGGPSGCRILVGQARRGGQPGVPWLGRGRALSWMGCAPTSTRKATNGSRTAAAARVRMLKTETLMAETARQKPRRSRPRARRKRVSRRGRLARLPRLP